VSFQAVDEDDVGDHRLREAKPERSRLLPVIVQSFLPAGCPAFRLARAEAHILPA